VCDLPRDRTPRAFFGCPPNDKPPGRRPHRCELKPTSCSQATAPIKGSKQWRRLWIQDAKLSLSSAVIKLRALLFGTDDRKIGSVQRVTLDKVSGKVAYAVISFGGSSGWVRTITLAVAKSQIRPEPQRIPGWRYREPAERRTHTQSLHRLGLVRPRARPPGLRLLSTPLWY
jgi:hypothetical protein